MLRNVNLVLLFDFLPIKLKICRILRVEIVDLSETDASLAECQNSSQMTGPRHHHVMLMN